MAKNQVKPIRPPEKETCKEAFLEALADGVQVVQAARASGASYRALYNWKQEDPLFAIEWDIAYRQGTDELAVEARRRGVEGVTKPVFYLGKIIGAVQEYSDPLLVMMLKARDPGTYCDKLRAARILKAEQEDAERRARETEATENEFNAFVREELDRIAAAKTVNALH